MKVLIILYLCGYGFSILGGLVFVRLIVNKMWKQIGWDGDPVDDPRRPYAWYASIVGSLDSFLYTSSVLIGKPEFIVGWLLFKVAGKWIRKSKDLKIKTTADDPIHGKHDYNIYIIGNAMGRSYGVIGAKIIEWYPCCWYKSIICSISLILLTFILYGWIKCYDIKMKSFLEKNKV